MRVDNFGGRGTRMLFDATGVEDVSSDFHMRAAPRLVPPPLASGTSMQDGPTLFKVFGYAEYNLERPIALTGSCLCENGLSNPAASHPRWLCPTRLPINAYVDRELCAEFQALEATCETISGALRAGDAASRAEVRGTFQLIVSGACCISCVGAVRQFQLIWPGLSIAVGMAPRVGMRASSAGPLSPA